MIAGLQHRRIRSSSIFDGLSLVCHDGAVEINYPNRIHDYARAAAFAQSAGLDVIPGVADGWRLQYSGSEGIFRHDVKAFFAQLTYAPAGSTPRRA